VIRIKICGLIDIDSALAAARARADFLGLVFAPSRHQVSLEKAREIVVSIKKSEARSSIVGVFVNLPAREVNYLAETCRLDWVQLSGNESWEYCREIKYPIIKAIHIYAESKIAEILRVIDKGYSVLEDDRIIFLLDSADQNACGGTGKRFNWTLAREISARFPVIIAGGLTPDNVGQLINQAPIWGVDVSSGVETEGKKDAQKIRDFINNVRSLSGEKSHVSNYEK
jgi:phosphoribosylanthranilate isomerase